MPISANVKKIPAYKTNNQQRTRQKFDKSSIQIQRNKSLDKRKTEEGLGFPEISFRLLLTWFIGFSLVFLAILLF